MQRCLSRNCCGKLVINFLRHVPFSVQQPWHFPLRAERFPVQKNFGFDFFPTRSSFLRFLKKYAIEDADTYDRLFNIENTADVPEGKTYLDFLNPESLTKIEGAMVEPSLEAAEGGEKFQFVRFGYFCKDTKNENTYNQVVSLKDNAKK